MTRSVYIIGGAGTGKSTFMAQLIDRTSATMGPLRDLHQKPNSRGTVITLRGHALSNGQFGEGIYLGVMRDSFPGTDGLDRVSCVPGEAWLLAGDLPDFILAEGATLATRGFMDTLREQTDLLVIHLVADDFVKELRFEERGSNQDDKFVLATETRSMNLAVALTKDKADVITIDSAEPDLWNAALDECVSHLS